MKADGYILTPELLRWRQFHRPVVVQVLIHILLSSTHSEASVAPLSYRDLAQQLHTSVKSIRVAIDVLIAENIITKCSSPRASTMVYINSSHPLTHCIIPWQDDTRAQIGAHSRAQKRALKQVLQIPANQVVLVGDTQTKGTDRAQIGAQPRAQMKNGAQPRAQIGAQISHSETPLNKGDSEDFDTDKGTDRGKGKGTEVRRKKQIKENIPPTTPIKENKERKQKAHTHTQKKEKEKKSVDADEQYAEVLRLFNRLFQGTKVRPVSKMTPERKKMVAKFISDYSFEDIEPMLRKALDSDLLSGRKDGGSFISFNWIFNPENYEQLIEGTFDNPQLDLSGTPKLQSTPPPVTPQPQHEDTEAEIEARLKQKEAQRVAIEHEQTEALRNKYLGWIESSKANPHGSMAKMVRQAYEDGTLAKLGIVWNPSVEEEEQSLADLDDQTQDYLQNLLGG